MPATDPPWETMFGHLMDLTQEELDGIVDLASAAAWAELSGDALESFMAHLGANETTKLRTVAAIPLQEYSGLLASWSIPGKDGRWPTAIERAAATNFGHAIRVKMRKESWAASRAQTSQTPVDEPKD